ncbi:MAG: cysteine hydrolase [Chloroflexi bacterium]|nr:cysteine hydrolase [Chloroflexota bacterium]
MGELQAETVLLVIDAQTGFFESDPPVHQADEMLERINNVIKQARAVEVPVIFVRHDEGPESEWPLHPQLARQEGDFVVNKMTPDSFYETDLQEQLANLEAKALVICGFQTEFCIDTTTRRAFSMGYEVTLLEDVHSTFGGPVIDAATIIAHHSAVLEGFASVIPSADLTF